MRLGGIDVMNRRYRGLSTASGSVPLRSLSSAPACDAPCKVAILPQTGGVDVRREGGVGSAVRGAEMRRVTTKCLAIPPREVSRYQYRGVW